MPETQLFKEVAETPRSEIADALRDAAEQVESGTVELESADGSHRVDVPAGPTFEVELERLTDSETGKVTHELEYELSWTESA